MKKILTAAAAAVAAVLAFSGTIAEAQGLTGISPVVSAGNVATLVVKTVPATALMTTATNASATAGFLIGYNAVAAPADGSLTGSLVLDCVALPANGTAIINDKPGPGTNYTVGVTYILSSGANCYTKTTGVITGFIKSEIQ